MEGFYAMRNELREAFYPLIKNSATEEKFIEYIKISIEKSNRFDIRALEVVLDLSLVVLRPSCELDHYCDSNDDVITKNDSDIQDSDEGSEIKDNWLSHPYDADDEDLDEVFIFPCHLNFDECHPESLHNYHNDHLRTARTTLLLIKYPKICSFVIEYMFSSVKLQLEILKADKDLKKLRPEVSDDIRYGAQRNVTRDSVNNYLNSVAILIKRINNVCLVERRNCRILSKVNVLNTIMSNIIYLLEQVPEKQHIYLQPMLKFAFNLADYRINGNNLKQLFWIIKNENADLKTVLSSFEQLLNHQFYICKNIQPMKSLNFPVASKTPEEIRSDLYILNSWHWRLRSKVIEFKRKRSRSIDNQNTTYQSKVTIEGQDTTSTVPLDSIAASKTTTLNKITEALTHDKTTPSWLECSMIAPLSNISPLIHAGGVKLSCSLWMSICGDLLVIDEREALCRRKTQNQDQETYIMPNWRNRNGFWLRLISRKRLVKRYTSDKKNQGYRKPFVRRKRRLSEKIKTRLADDKRDEEEEESYQRLKRSEAELEQQQVTAFGLRKNISFISNHSSSKYSSFIRPTMTNSPIRATSISRDKQPMKQPKDFLSRRAIENDQKLLIHLISFAMDTMTIEIWLNVKSMSFCARVCRVAREGLTNVIDQTEFPSHLQANGSWSHILFSLHEANKSHGSHDKFMHLRLLVDGIYEEETKLSYGVHKSPLTNFALLLGCERSTFGYVWKLSQVNVYKSIPSEDISIFLLGKGPDFRNFTNFTTQQSTLPLPDITQRSIKNLMNPKLLSIYSIIDEGMCLDWLTQNIVLAYVAHQPDHFLDYSTSMVASSLMNPLPANHEFSNSAERFIQARVLNFTRSLKFNTNEGFGSALVEAGGIESVLICFTDVIRRAQETSDIHHLAFSILLKMSQTNQHHLNKFIDDLNGLKLVEFILIHPDCIISEQMLDYYLDFCLMKENCSLIKSSKLIYCLLTSWRAWHKNISVAKKLYRELIRLLEPSEQIFPTYSIMRHNNQRDYINHNFNMLTNAGGIDLLMNILRECLDDTSTKIDHQLVELIANLISALIKPTPGLDVMLDIVEFLLFLHPDVKSYVEGSINKISFLHELNATQLDEAAIYDETDEGRTMSSESFDSSLNDMNPNDGISRFRRRNIDLRGSHTTVISSSNDEEAGTDQYTSTDEMNNVSGFMVSRGIEKQQKVHTYATGNWFGYQNQSARTKQDNSKTRALDSSEVLDCSHRDYAIANIVDILSNIVVKLTSTDPSKILSEALQKPIIDTRKLIILANNDSILVREKVLCLFLRCIRACYSLNLKTVLAKYEQETKSSIFKVCIPIQLMGCQLLKYPTTSKMIQLCYGVIVGINESETVKPDCFDIESIDNLQLNTLILLIQMTSGLDNPKDISYWIEFIYSFIKQLIQLNADGEILSFLIKSNLVECLMKIYFSYIEHEIERNKSNVEQNSYRDKDPIKIQSEELLKSLDKALVLVVSYFIKYQPMSDSIESIKDLLTYLNIMNTYVTSKRYQRILRDRQVKVLSTAIGYCKHYENCARSREYEGRLDYHVKNFLKTAYFETPTKLLSPSELRIDSFLEEEEGEEEEDEHDSTGSQYLSTSPPDEFINRYTDSYADKPYTQNTENVSEVDVKEFFKATLEFVVDFIRIREADIITSPLEKQFIIHLIELLTKYLSEHSNWVNLGQSINCHWMILLRDLSEPIKTSFNDLVLYLISPCKSMNIDERKYYASELLKIFSKQEQAFDLLDNEDTCKILVYFIKDLINQSDVSIYKEDNEQTIDDILENDTENKLKSLARSIEAHIPQTNGIGMANGKSGKQYKNLLKRRKPATSNSKLPYDIMASKWILELEQKRELALQSIEILKENRLLNVVRSNSIFNSLDISTRLLDEAYNITRDVGDDRNEQRKAYFEDLKQNKVYNYHTRQQWLSLIIGNTHERTIWFMNDHHPSSWELNPVEGPSRIRRRLRPCKLMLDSRFLRRPNVNQAPKEPNRQELIFNNDSDDCSKESSTNIKSSNNIEELEVMLDDWCILYSPHPLCSMIINHGQSMSSNELRTRKFTTDKIPFNCDCSIIRANEVCDGEVLIASWCIHFIGERSENYQKDLNEKTLTQNKRIEHETNDFGSQSTQQTRSHMNNDQTSGSNIKSSGKSSRYSKREFIKQIIVEDLWFDEIVEIWDRRYQLQDVGLEIFLTNNMTYLIGFKNNKQRENFKQSLMREQHKMINLQRFNLNTSLNRVTLLWREGKLTNFDYLTCLNKLAGRSFNDLMQYPVFPFILSNYTSSFLDLTSPNNFRKLSKPMAIQNSEKEPVYLRNYEDSQSTNLSPGLPGMSNEPYHYGNHYSNSATVLHFLVRLPPFTQMLIQYQDNNFDQPDRTFHSIALLWQLITKDSNTDFKELIPEFFFLPEMFLNFEQLDLGVKQNNELVDDVKMPAWCPNSDARLFTLIHRQALESAYVSEHLHHWIDLIFGYKQTGKPAIEALNVFHPATYYGMIDLHSQQNISDLPTTPIKSVIANLSGKPYASSSLNDSQLSNNDSNSQVNSLGSIQTRDLSQHQAKLERKALETMIKTYGQMPRQLFRQPMKQRAMGTFVSSRTVMDTSKNSKQAITNSQDANDGYVKKIEPLKQVRGLKWGSFVGSPDENEIIAVKHKKIISDEVLAQNKRNLIRRRYNNHSKFDSYASRNQTKFSLCLLPNGEIAILRNNTSLMLDYRADRKSGGSFQFSVPSAKLSRRAGLSSVGRMNLFSNMIISRQQFSYMDITGHVQSETGSLSSSSLVSLTSSRVKFSHDSLSLVSWSYLDGTIRIRNPASNTQKSSVPLVQADSNVDTMTTCASVPELNLFLIGYESGCICAHIVSTTYETVAVAQQPPTNYPNDNSLYLNKASSTDKISISSIVSVAATAQSSFNPSSSPLSQPSQSNFTSSSHNILRPDANNLSNGGASDIYMPLYLVGKTLQNVKTLKKTTRWLSCHSKKINCMKINVSFGIVVTGSDDGTAVIWDLNSLTYVRTIDYKLESSTLKRGATNVSNSPVEVGELQEPTVNIPPRNSSFLNNYYQSINNKYQQQLLLDYLCDCDRSLESSLMTSEKKLGNTTINHSTMSTTSGNNENNSKGSSSKQCYICGSGINLIAISDTLGDIVTVKDISNRLAMASESEPSTDINDDDDDAVGSDGASINLSSSMSTTSTNQSIELGETGSLTSVIYAHTINGALVGFVSLHTQVTAVCYSNAPEGISVNVIVVGLADGLIRLYSSWDLCRVKEFHVFGISLPITSLLYSRDNQLLYITYEDGQLVVLRNKKKSSVPLLKELYL